jgi:hypothetical protein
MDERQGETTRRTTEVDDENSCPLWRDKRARQQRDRDAITSGERTQESMLWFSPEGVAKMKIRHRTNEF